jgi:hypothetical protein
MSQFGGGGGMPPTPWYKENPFWGGISGFFTFAIAGLGFGLNGYPTLGRWLLWVAAPWGTMALWLSCKGAIRNKRVSIAGNVGGFVFLIALLFWGDRSIKHAASSSAPQPVAQPIAVQPLPQPAQSLPKTQPQSAENPPAEAQRRLLLKPYNLTGRRRDIFLVLSNTQLEPRDTIRVGCIGWSESSCVAAGSFLLLLSQAGWKIDSNRVFRLEPSIPSDGMTIAARTPVYTDNLPPHLGHWGAMDASQITIWRAFTWMQIPTGASGDPNMPEGTIGVYFGPEPTVQSRSAGETRKQLHDLLTVLLVTSVAVEKACSVADDTCTMQRRQWTQTISAYMEYCDCGLNAAWLGKWKSLAASGDLENDPLKAIQDQKQQLAKFVAALK